MKLSFDFQAIKHRVRMILAAAEQAALTPVSPNNLHTFAYLADILSPVWNLRPFQDRIGRREQLPYYPDLQRQIDILVGIDFVELSDLSYEVDDGLRARFNASYVLLYESVHFGELASTLEMDEDLGVNRPTWMRSPMLLQHFLTMKYLRRPATIWLMKGPAQIISTI